VGHTLGLRHNFPASTLQPFEKLHDAALTKKMGLSSSVMDYLAVNLAAEGQTQGEYWPTSLGPYDHWAVEYAYKLLPATSPEAERPALQRIAARAAEPPLAYGTDEDLFGYTTTPAGIDPRTNWGDYGDDPLPFYRQRVTLVHELWRKLETKAARPAEGYQVLRRSFDRGFGELWMAMLNTSKYVSGIYHHRDHAGDPGERPPYQPVPADKQRAALALLTEAAFASKAFELPPSLLNKLASDRFWTFEGETFDEKQRIDYPIHDQVLTLQRMILDRLHHPTALARLQDLEVKYADPKQAFTMADFFQGMQEGIWTELQSPPASINSFRRALQREHLKRLMRLVLRPEAGTPEDATTLARFHLTRLRQQAQGIVAANDAQLGTATLAHLQETLARIDETLKAQLQQTVN
ncbi:MAG: zinc-dependent metalloprotease, partial [Gammaproteobacteria bacterium]